MQFQIINELRVFGCSECSSRQRPEPSDEVAMEMTWLNLFSRNVDEDKQLVTTFEQNDVEGHAAIFYKLWVMMDDKFWDTVPTYFSTSWLDKERILYNNNKLSILFSEAAE